MGGYVSSGPGHYFNQFNDFKSDKQLTQELIKEILEHNVEHIQTSTLDLDKISTATWKTLNEEIFKSKPHIRLRLFGYGSGNLDLEILQYLDNVEMLCIDGVTAHNPHWLSRLTRLKELTFETRNPDSYDFFSELNPGLEKLIIGTDNESAMGIDLSPTLHFKNLDYLFLIGHNKNLPKLLPQFSKLESLVLKKTKPVANIDFVKQMPALKNLHLKGGSLKNLDALQDLPKLEYLELYNLNAIKDLQFLSTMTGLRELFLQSIKNPQRFPDLSGLNNFKTLEMWWVKNLRDLSAIEFSHLESFECAEASTHEPEDFIPVLKNKNIKKIKIILPTDKKRNELARLMKVYNREPN